jgi:hypothetical protein
MLDHTLSRVFQISVEKQKERTCIELEEGALKYKLS